MASFFATSFLRCSLIKRSSLCYRLSFRHRRLSVPRQTPPRSFVLLFSSSRLPRFFFLPFSLSPFCLLSFTDLSWRVPFPFFLRPCPGDSQPSLVVSSSTPELLNGERDQDKVDLSERSPDLQCQEEVGSGAGWNLLSLWKAPTRVYPSEEQSPSLVLTHKILLINGGTVPWVSSPVLCPLGVETNPFYNLQTYFPPPPVSRGT